MPYKLILWFLLTPQTIYGGDVAVVVFTASIAVFILQNMSIRHNKNKFSLIVLFVISITYFEYKNFDRVYKEYFQYFDNYKYFPWIKIEENKFNEDYSSIFINNVKINVKNKKEGRKLGLPDECGNINMFCLPVERVQCIGKITIKKNYYFFEGNEQKCIDHLRYRAFY